MAYNILGITPGHNSSVALVSNGKLVYYLEEERLSKFKHDNFPIRSILFILRKYKIDEVVVTGAGNQSPSMLKLSNPQSIENLYHSVIRKFYPLVKFTDYSHSHHLTHASSAFYNSGFKKALGIVIDGNGSDYEFNGKMILETESTFYCTYPSNFKKINYRCISHDLDIIDPTKNLEITTNLTIGKQYHAVTEYLGFSGIGEEGKTMGLSSYGKDSFIPSILNTPISTSFKTKPSMGIIMGEYIYPLKDNLQNKKNLAWRIQSDTQQLVGDYIEKGLKETGLKQVCCAGGYFLNCVANYYLTKRFPDIEFYFEPIAHDGGTSIGAAFYKWYEYSKSTNIISQNTLYHGPKYSKKELLTKIKNFINGI